MIYRYPRCPRQAIPLIRKKRYSYLMPSGEEIQRKGEEGAHRAKRWLERTLRAKVQWVNPDPTAVKKLTYKWPGNSNTFSFDLGGSFIGQGDDDSKTREGENFFAEVKNYSSASDQLSMFTDFLAKCYVVRKEDPKFADVFLWITWSPFGVTKWDQLRSPKEIKKAILNKRNQTRSLNISNTQEAEEALSQEKEFLDNLSKDIWILVLSKEQEDFLTISREEMGVIAQYRTGKEG